MTHFNTTHGLTNHELFGRWHHIKDRCYNKNKDNYHNYGGRGITVCDEWKDNFQAFYDWAITHGYEKHLQIHRVDNDLGYSPDNCIWVTCKQNTNEKRNNVSLTIFGESKTISQWRDDERCKAKNDSFGDRIRAGWEPEKALTTPTRKKHNGKQ